MSRDETCRALLRAGTIKFGEFTYASGAKGPIYIDLRRLVSFPEELSTVCSHLAKLINELGNTNIVLGAATAGIPFSTLVSKETKIPMCYIRKQAKGHGTQSQIEGVYERGQKAVLIDDLITSGASKKIFVLGGRDAGLTIDDLVVVLDRRADNDKGAIDELNVKLHSLATLRELVEVVRKEGGATEEELDRVEKWLKGEEW